MTKEGRFGILSPWEFKRHCF